MEWHTQTVPAAIKRRPEGDFSEVVPLNGAHGVELGRHQVGQEQNSRRCGAVNPREVSNQQWSAPYARGQLVV
jgi:hypothetical protein